MTMQSDAERRLFEADDERCRAMLANDLDALERVLADDVVYTHSSAVVEGKAQYLQALREGRSRYLAVRRQSAQVRLYGPVAVMHGHVIMQIEIQTGGAPVQGASQGQSTVPEDQRASSQAPGSGTAGKQIKDLNNLFQAVWVERDGRWLLASWASTVIPPENKTL